MVLGFLLLLALAALIVLVVRSFTAGPPAPPPYRGRRTGEEHGAGHRGGAARERRDHARPVPRDHPGARRGPPPGLTPASGIADTAVDGCLGPRHPSLLPSWHGDALARSPLAAGGRLARARRPRPRRIRGSRAARRARVAHVAVADERACDARRDPRGAAAVQPRPDAEPVGRSAAARRATSASSGSPTPATSTSPTAPTVRRPRSRRSRRRSSAPACSWRSAATTP